MKKVIDITINSSSLCNLHRLVSKAMEQNITKEIIIFPLSFDAIMKRIQDGTLPIKVMESTMKISHSKFFHFYGDNMKETIIQISFDKIAIFTDEN